MTSTDAMMNIECLDHIDDTGREGLDLQKACPARHGQAMERFTLTNNNNDTLVLYNYEIPPGSKKCMVVDVSFKQLKGDGYEFPGKGFAVEQYFLPVQKGEYKKFLNECKKDKMIERVSVQAFKLNVVVCVCAGGVCVEECAVCTIAFLNLAILVL